MAHNVGVSGSLVWSFLGRLGSHLGYDQRFGIVHVDFDPHEHRTRDSGPDRADVASRGVP
ncbi:hypothetical protein BH23ACT5_BH23ACT5_13060 [soil metagenome]